MKTYLLAAVIGVLSVFTFAGCANESSSNATAGANPSDRTYNRQDLNNTGRQDTAGALQAADPSVTVSGGGRGSGR